MNTQAVRPQFDPTFNWGHVGVILSICVSAVLFYSNVSNEVEEGKKYRALYEPMIQSMVMADKLHDERITNLSIAIGDDKQAIMALTHRVEDLSQSLAVMQGQDGNRPRKPVGASP